MLSLSGCHRSGGGRDADCPAAATAQARPATGASRPVILLTGFEPFGEARPPNPSWDGIAALDGRQWHDYRLVCKRMRVEWGAARRQLQQWIAEYHPVAIFSFGEGLPGAFALESEASNSRGQYPDNRDALPPSPAIVDGGPAAFHSALDLAAFSRAFRKRIPGPRIDARGPLPLRGMLYSLEYLKTKNPLGTVSFCHVPPLGTRVGDKPVTAAYVRQFVEAPARNMAYGQSRGGPFTPGRRIT